MTKNIKEIVKIDQKKGGVLCLILNDPKNKNALSEEMMIELQKQILNASSNDSIRVIVISAVGDVFCSGHNLKEITDARNNKDKGKEFLLFGKIPLIALIFPPIGFAMLLNYLLTKQNKE